MGGAAEGDARGSGEFRAVLVEELGHRARGAAALIAICCRTPSVPVDPIAMKIVRIRSSAAVRSRKYPRTLVRPWVAIRGAGTSAGPGW